MITKDKKSVLTTFTEIGDERGNLVSLEALKNIPFKIKRVYYMYGMPTNVSRGFHAHKSLQQMLVCISGSCEVILNDGYSMQIYTLNKQNQGLFIDRMVWHEIQGYSQDCAIMVLASDHYNETDYIRNYDNFIEQKTCISFVDYDATFLDLSTKWLNDPETKKFTLTVDFDCEMQMKCFNALQNRDDYFIKGICYKGEEIGVLGIKNIKGHCGELWGYIGKKNLRGKGLGKCLLEYALRQAKLLGLNYLYTKIDVNNEMSLKLTKNTFKEMYIENNIVHMIKYIE